MSAAGEEAETRSPDLGHILAGGQIRQPAAEASVGSQKRPPPLEHPAEEPSTPQKPKSEGDLPDIAEPG